MRAEKVQYRSKAAARSILRYGALCAPLTMIVYEVILSTGVLPPSEFSEPPGILKILFFSSAWLLLGLATFIIRQPRRMIAIAVEVAIYFTLMIAQTWFVSGAVSPFSAYWVLLLMATYVLLDRKGLVIGFVVFMMTLIVDTLVFHGGDPTWVLISLMTAITILVTTLVMAAVFASQRTTYQELVASQVKVENERNQNATLINNVTDAVISTDHNGIVTSYNSAALDILDTNKTIDGEYISNILNLATTDRKELDVFKELSKDISIRRRNDIVMQLPDGDYMRLEVTFAPVQGSYDESNLPDNYVLILRDITILKSLEEERDEFISVVSHELRTPVAITEGALSNAKLLAERDGQDKIVSTLDDAHKQVVFLAKMVNDLSTLSRAEKGISDSPEEIDVSEIAQELYRQYTPHAELKNLQFNLDILGKPGIVYTSKLYLQELLQNFITNAIKYTKEGSVTLHIRRNDDKITFTVEDTGIGIRRADLKKIFSRFYRAEDYRTRETSGTGLGLYVAKKLADKLGCSISVQSRLNHGSKFSFSLPVKESGKTD